MTWLRQTPRVKSLVDLGKQVEVRLLGLTDMWSEVRDCALESRVRRLGKHKGCTDRPEVTG